MKKILFLFFPLVAITFFTKADYWLSKANYPHVAAAALSFSIGAKGYVGGGTNYFVVKKDFWEYDTLTNVWTQKANLGGGKRGGGICFAIGNKGYIGLGTDSVYQGEFKNDIWEYDPALNTWTQKGNFPGPQRVGCTTFTIGDKAFVCAGNDSTSLLNDLWEYYYSTDTWIQKASLPAPARWAHIGIAIGNKGYVGLGYDGTFLKDFWEYDSLSNSWTQKADFPGAERRDAMGFSICERGFVGFGEYPAGSFHNDFYEYNPTSDTWTPKTFFSGGSRDVGFSFVIGNKGYIGSGGAYPTVYTDFWQYTPDSVCITTGITEQITKEYLNIYPVPFSNFLSIAGTKLDDEIIIYDMKGKEILRQKAFHGETKLITEKISSGYYLLHYSDGKTIANYKLTKQ